MSFELGVIIEKAGNYEFVQRRNSFIDEVFRIDQIKY
jgi:hypothetical protein